MSASPLYSHETGDTIDDSSLAGTTKQLIDRPRNALADCGNCCPKRYTLASLSSAGLIVIFAMRYNFSIAIAVVTGSTIYNTTNTTLSVDERFQWSHETISLVDSSFYWGYIVTPILGGFLATRYPAQRVFGFGIAFSSIMNLVIPSVAGVSVVGLIVVRVLQGLAEGLSFPAIMGIWSRWAPPNERTTLLTIIFTGGYIAILFSMLITGIIIRGLGWQALFYVCGGIGVVWWLLWFAFVFETPAGHPRISMHERALIEQSLADTAPELYVKKFEVPWHDILTSLPVYAIVFSSICTTWTFYMYTTGQLIYAAKILKIPRNEMIICIVPFILAIIIVPSVGYLADYVRRTEKLTTKITRQTLNSVGFIGQALFFLFSGVINNDIGYFVCMTIAICFSAVTWSGYAVNPLDIAPRFASVIQGLAVTVSAVGGILSPIILQLYAANGNKREWTICLLMTCVINLFCAMFFLIYGEGEKQPWAEGDVDFDPLKLNAGKNKNSDALLPVLESVATLLPQAVDDNITNDGEQPTPTPTQYGATEQSTAIPTPVTDETQE